MQDQFDLESTDVRPRSQEGVEMTLLDPAGRRTPVVLRVRGTDCEMYNEKLREQVRRGIERGPRKATEEERNAEFYELHATLIAGWNDALRLGGKPFVHTPENAARLLEDYAYIFEQVRRFSDNRVNFLPGSASS